LIACSKDSLLVISTSTLYEYVSSGMLVLCLVLASDLRHDFSSFLSVTAVSLDNILELALVTAGNEDPAAVLDKGESDHETDT
jgi:hypothetical protein